MGLDDLCRYQSKWAPDNYSLKGACYPPREGRVRDLIAWRKGITTAEAWESSDKEEEEDEEDQERECQEKKEIQEKTEGQPNQMDASNNDEPKDILDKPVAQKEDDILLEDKDSTSCWLS